MLLLSTFKYSRVRAYDSCGQGQWWSKGRKNGYLKRILRVEFKNLHKLIASEKKTPFSVGTTMRRA